jgi:excisionase family DNA binding protein
LTTMENVIEIAGRRFVSAAILADALHIHKRTIVTWAEDHGLPVIKVGNMRLFDLADVSEWLHSHKRQAEV